MAERLKGWKILKGMPKASRKNSQENLKKSSMNREHFERLYIRAPI